MTIIPLWAKALVLAVLIGAAVLAVNAWGDKHEQIGYDRAAAEYSVKLAEAKEQALEKERFMRKQMEDARNAEIKRAKEKDARITALAAASDGLRNTVADLRERLATATADACRKTADAFATVFEECRGAYAEMGSAAEGHASDALMCQEAWPK